MLHRLRITAALLVVVALAFFILPRVQAQPVATSIVAVHQSTHQAPLAPRTIPINLVALGAIAGATAVKRSRSNPNMIIDSIIHVARRDDGGKPMTLVINPGVLADDTELTDDEIDESIARGSIRYATPAELHRLSQVAAQRETAKIARDVARDTATMNASVDAERQRIIGDLEAEKQRQLAALDEKVEQARTDLAKDAAERTASAASTSSKRAAATSATRTSTAGAASATRSAAPVPVASAEARAQAAGGTATPPANASTSPDVGAEASQPNPAPASPPPSSTPAK